MNAWSFSSLSSYETCPLRYYLTRVAEDRVVEPESEAIIWGNFVHEALEEYLRDGKALPKTISNLQSLVDKLTSKKGELLVEQKMGVTENLESCDFFSKDCWYRGIVDVAIVNKNKAVILDWKTGKRKLNSDQLDLFAGLVFAHYPDVTDVVTGFVWLKDNKVDTQRYSRDDIRKIWMNFIPRVERLQRSYSEDKWLPKPSGLCRNWCPVGKSRCDHCGV